VCGADKLKASLSKSKREVRRRPSQNIFFVGGVNNQKYSSSAREERINRETRDRKRGENAAKRDRRWIGSCEYPSAWDVRREARKEEKRERSQC
jgi:hypothetical protein